MQDNIDRLKWSRKSVETLPAIIKALKKETLGYGPNLADLDKKVLKILHIVEAPMSAHKMSVFMKELSMLRRERRAMKQRYLLVRTALKFSGSPYQELKEALQIQADKNLGITNLAKIDSKRMFEELTAKEG